MAQMVKDHPDVVTIVDYGQTYEKRTISLLKVMQTCSKNVQKRVCLK